MRVRTQLNYGLGSPGLMTHYFGTDDTAYSEIEAQLAIDRVRDAFSISLQLFPPQLAFQVLSQVDVIRPSDGEVQDSLTGTERNFVGTNASGLGPLAIGLLLKLRTNTFIQGHRLVGRTFLVPIAGNLTTAPVVPTSMTDAVVAIGNALNDSGINAIDNYVWSRPRPATAVGPGRPAGPARLARAGSRAKVTSYGSSTKYVVMTSRRD